MMMSSLHLRLRLIFASACITHNALEKWSKASDRSCVFVWWVRRFSRLFLIDWLIRSSLSTVVCSAGQAKSSGVDGDSGIGAASYSWRTACGGGGVSSDWIQLLISQQTSGQLHHSHVNCVCSIRAGFWGSITDFFSCYRIKLWVYQQDVHRLTSLTQAMSHVTWQT